MYAHGAGDTGECIFGEPGAPAVGGLFRAAGVACRACISQGPDEDTAVVVKTVLGSHFGWVNSPIPFWGR